MLNRTTNLNKTIGYILMILTCISCQKKYTDDHTQDEVIVEFAARLEEQSPQYQYDHSQRLPTKEGANLR